MADPQEIRQREGTVFFSTWCSKSLRTRCLGALGVLGLGAELDKKHVESLLFNDLLN